MWVMGVALEKNFHGVWGRPTATIDWCEANYEVTYYIAEFWNTVSNLVMIGLPIMGFIHCAKDRLETRYWWSYVALFFVGVGSWLFHGTLLYESQLLDELPMIWGSSFLIYSLHEVSSNSKRPNFKLIALLFAYCSFTSIIYLAIKQPVFHETMYALMVFTMMYYSYDIISQQSHSTRLYITSILLYGVGFIIWNLDNHFCETFREARGSVGYPLKVALQGHAWWHILAGTGTHISIIFSIHARAMHLRQEVLVQKPLGLLPLIVRVKKPL